MTTPINLTETEKAEAIAWAESRFESAAVLSMAKFAIQNSGRTFTLTELASEVKSEPDTLKNFSAIFAKFPRASKEVQGSASAMRGFISRFNGASSKANRGFALKALGRIDPTTFVCLVRAEKKAAASREFSAVEIDDSTRFETGKFRIVADPKDPTPLYINVVRVNEVWKPPPDMIKDYPRWAWTEKPAAPELIVRDHHGELRGEYPRRGVALLSEGDPDAPWDGQCFACWNLEEKKPVPEINGRIIQLSVVRIHFRDYWIATRSMKKIPHSNGSVRDYLMTLGKAPNRWPGVPEPHAMIFVAVLVVLNRKTVNHKPCIALCLHRDVNKLYEPTSGVYWGPTAQSLCVSARIRDDPRPIDLQVQISRMLARQSGIEPSMGTAPVWLGVAFEPEKFRVVLYAAVEIDATPMELIRAFERRESRHLEEKMAILNLEDVVSAMKEEPRAAFLNRLLPEPHAMTSTLPMALGLYLTHRGEATPLV